MTENKGDGQKVKYNAAGLVTEMRSLSNVLKVKYAYDDKGQRIRKVDYDGSGNVTLTTWYVHAPSGIYEQQPSSTTVLQTEVPIGGNLGTMYPQAGYVSLYALKDHLGNVRATFTRGGVLENWTDYEPWGMPMVGRMATASLAYRYGFQGQETDQIGGVRTPAFELRLWDSRIGRWTAPDPYGQFWSPYVGMGNNPVNGADADGGWFGGPGASAFLVWDDAIGEFTLAAVGISRLSKETIRAMIAFAIRGVMQAIAEDFTLGTLPIRPLAPEEIQNDYARVAYGVGMYAGHTHMMAEGTARAMAAPEAAGAALSSATVDGPIGLAAAGAITVAGAHGIAQATTATANLTKLDLNRYCNRMNNGGGGSDIDRRYAETSGKGPSSQKRRSSG